MALTSPARLASPEVRTALYYSTMFLPAGAATLLLSIWLDDQGISPEQIGIINALPIFLMIVLNLVVGRVADKARDWRTVIVAGSLIGGAAPIGFLFVDGFWGILLIWTLATVPFLAIEPVIDAAAIHMTRRRGSDFALVRVWGTLGFVAASIVCGLIFDWIGIAVFVPLFIATCLLRGVISLQLPLFRAPASDEAGRARPTSNADAADTMRQVFKPWFILTLVGTAMLQASHLLLLGFGPLLWRQAGIPDGVIGILWAIGPIAEIVTMLFFARLARRFSGRHLLLAACVCGVLRWSGMALVPEVWSLAVMQLLHMATFGLAYLGIVNFIANWTTEKIAAQAQSFFVTLRQAANVGALLAFGPLVAMFGIQSFYAAAALAALGAGMIVFSLIIMSAKR